MLDTIKLLVLLTTLYVPTEAKSLGGRVPNNSTRPDVLVFLGLLGDEAAAIDAPSVLLVVDENRTVDPNIVLMLENFQPGGRSGEPRPTRDMSSEDMEEMDSSRPPSKYLSPPPAPAFGTRSKKNSNKVTGRSISSSHISNQPVEEEEERGPDFLTSLVTIPQVWMSEVSHLIIQPLRKPNPGERDSYEYFGMVAKAPFISCPLGFKKSSLGTCRPVFRSRRNYPASEALAALESTTTTNGESTTTNTITE